MLTLVSANALKSIALYNNLRTLRLDSIEDDAVVESLERNGLPGGSFPSVEYLDLHISDRLFTILIPHFTRVQEMKLVQGRCRSGLFTIVAKFPKPFDNLEKFIRTNGSNWNDFHIEAVDLVSFAGKATKLKVLDFECEDYDDDARVECENLNDLDILHMANQLPLLEEFHLRIRESSWAFFNVTEKAVIGLCDLCPNLKSLRLSAFIDWEKLLN